MAGDDFKIMGRRIDDRLGITIALAFVDRDVESASHYFFIKSTTVKWLGDRLGQACDIGIIMLDDPAAVDESGLYLTVTGLSAELGDDGPVVRGNRVSGFITPSRPMSLESAAGKNPVSHVGKIYNMLAMQMAGDLVLRIPGVDEAQVQLLSSIGQAINRPQLVTIAVGMKGSLTSDAVRHVERVAEEHLDGISSLSLKLAHGDLRVF